MSLLYKFLPTSTAFKVMESTRFKVSMLSELNDIFDCDAVCRTSVALTLQEDKQHAANVYRYFSSTFGVICFAKAYLSPLLWGHYADSAQGIALGFDKNVLSTQYESHFNVIYQEERPVVLLDAKCSSESEHEDRAIRLFGVKGSEWAYEKEHRYLITLRNCDTSAGMYFKPFPASALKHVIVGYRSNIEPFYLSRFLRQHFKTQEPKISYCRPHPAKYEIQLVSPPYGVADTLVPVIK